MTQADAAERLGMGATQLSRYETGHRQAPVSVIRAAEALYEQIILKVQPPDSVARETPSGEVRRQHLPGSRDARPRAYYQALLAASHRLSALAAEMLQEATHGLDREEGHLRGSSQ